MRSHSRDSTTEFVRFSWLQVQLLLQRLWTNGTLLWLVWWRTTGSQLSTLRNSWTCWSNVKTRWVFIITEVILLCLLLCNRVFLCSFISCILVLALYSFDLDLLTFGDFCRNFKPIYFSFRFKHVSRLVWTPRCLAVSLRLCFTHQKNLVVLVCCPWDTCSFLSQISGYLKFLFVVVVFLFLQFESRLSSFDERTCFRIKV